MNIIWEAIPLVTLAGTTLFCARKWSGAEDRATDLLEKGCGQFQRANDAERLLARQYALRIDVEDRLRKIEQQRHLSAKRARAAQLQQHRSKIAETTARLEQGL